MANKDEPAKERYAYMLRIMGRNPDQLPMERVGEYIAAFADLLGAENLPTFAGIKKASTGLKAKVPYAREHHAHARMVVAKTEPSSRPGRAMSRLQQMIDQDDIRQAQVLDRNNNVVYLFQGKTVQDAKTPAIYQTATVDGMVTGIVGADDTMHLHLRDYLNRDIRILVKSEALARDLLEHFRRGVIRVQASGTWKRTDFGWLPEASKCTLVSFEVLDSTPISEVLAQFAATPDNGWQSVEDPDQLLLQLRGDE
ncbi:MULTISPECIES: hypothetical protein [Delftia]|jgi:hypothetical protein|uniref:hypothetical protein n=1 Tax=Delftia TaxID=80865 RepID=UPI0013144132|nr:MULTISPECIES: hypothetical protein [Delftia]BDE70917.1 hypothetical protein HQS1_20410 [Delftia lacustris]